MSLNIAMTGILRQLQAIQTHLVQNLLILLPLVVSIRAVLGEIRKIVVEFLIDIIIRLFIRTIFWASV